MSEIIVVYKAADCQLGHEVKSCGVTFYLPDPTFIPDPAVIQGIEANTEEMLRSLGFLDPFTRMEINTEPFPWSGADFGAPAIDDPIVEVPESHPFKVGYFEPRFSIAIYHARRTFPDGTVVNLMDENEPGWKALEKLLLGESGGRLAWFPVLW